MIDAKGKQIYFNDILMKDGYYKVHEGQLETILTKEKKMIPVTEEDLRQYVRMGGMK